MDRTSPYLKVTLVAVLALSVGYAAPASADSSGRSSTSGAGSAPATITTTSDGWIVYPSVLDRIVVSSGSKAKARTEVVRGRVADGACHLDLSGTASASAQLHIEESAFQPSTCQFKVTTTPLTASESLALAATGSTSGGLSVSSATKAATPGAQRTAATAAPAVAAASAYSGHVQGQWWDPINIKIAHQTVNMGWNYYASPYTWWSNTYGFAAWLLTPTNIWIWDETYYKAGSSSKSGARFSAYANMQNDSFLFWVLYSFGAAGWTACGFPTSPTANFYFNESITAAGSYFNYSTGDSKSGACTNLVHHAANIGGGYA